MGTFHSIKGYGGNYEINVDGLVRNVRTGQMKRASIGNKGYLTISLWSQGKPRLTLIHRLLAETFIPNPKGFKLINHKDGNKLNNSIENLEWCDHSHNNKHAYDHGLRTATKRAVAQIGEDGKVIEIFESITSVVAKGFDLSCVWRSCRTGTLKHRGFKWRYHE